MESFAFAALHRGTFAASSIADVSCRTSARSEFHSARGLQARLGVGFQVGRRVHNIGALTIRIGFLGPIIPSL